MSLVDQCEREITRMHEVFAEWLRGDVPEDDEHFEAFSGVLGRDFVLVVPEGRMLRHPELIRAGRDAYGSRGDVEDFEIWIEDVEVQVEHGDLVVATYEEWQAAEGRRQCRVSSAVFSFDEEAPEGLIWRHLHETYLE